LPSFERNIEKIISFQCEQASNVSSNPPEINTRSIKILFWSTSFKGIQLFCSKPQFKSTNKFGSSLCWELHTIKERVKSDFGWIQIRLGVCSISMSISAKNFCLL
jgi:hypothetical protein